MLLKTSLKKLLLLTGFISLGATAQATVTAQSYTWDFSNPSAVMGGTFTNNGITSTNETIKGVETSAFSGGYGWELETSTFKDMLNAAQGNEGTLTFSFDISWGGNNTVETIFHIAQINKGVSLGLDNGKIGLVNNNLNRGQDGSSKVPNNAISLTASTWTSVTVSLLGSSVSITLDPTGGEASSYTTTLSTIEWNSTEEAENTKYSIGSKAPGYSAEQLNGSKIANLSVSYAPIPEPATATLTVMALAGLMLRRRRA